jgi:protein MpaA
MLVTVNEAFNWSDFLPEFEAAASAAGFRSSRYGATLSGDLIAWEKPGAGPRTYLSAGIHGDEPAGPMALLQLLQSGVFDGEGSWALCPALNPTGLASGTRENFEGRDLNRDYFTLRTSETSAHVRWLQSIGFIDRFISLHEDWEATGFYFYEINCEEDCPDRALTILQAVAPWFSPEPALLVDGHDVREAGWIYHPAEADLPEDWPEAIYLAKNGCRVSFTFETPSSAPLRSRVAAHVAAVKAVLALP